MNKSQLKAAQREITLCTGSKSTSLRPATDCLRQAPPLLGIDLNQIKSNTPYRISFRGLERTRSNRRRQTSKMRALSINRSIRSLDSVQRRKSSCSGKEHQIIELPKSPIWSQIKREPLVNARQEGVEKTSFPLPTVIVKCQLKIHFPPYSLPELRFVLSRYGTVVSVWRLQVNSAVVVFKDLRSAQQAVSNKTLGDPICRLSCHWLYPVLAQPNIFAAMKDQPTLSDICSDSFDSNKSL